MGAVLIALQLAFRAWAVYGSWFQFDDFAFLSRAYNQNLDWAYLTESYAGHLMPAGFLLTWLYASYEPLGWWPYATTLLALQAVAGIGFLRLLVHLFGRRRAVLPLLAIYLFSVISLPAFIWWAAGINQLPLQIALFFGLHSHVTYLRTHRLRYAVATAAWTLFGLAFYEKTLLVFLAYGLVALCYFAKGTFEDRLIALWSSYRSGIILLTVLFVGYLALYLTTSLNFDPNNANHTPVFPVAYRFVFVAFATGIIGGPWGWQDLQPVGRVADPSDIVVFVSWLAIGYLVFLAYRTRERSLRAWLLPASFLVANLLLLTAGRAFLVGAVIGREYRYQTEMPAVFALGVGLAFLPLLGARETVASREYALPFRVSTAVLACTAVFLGGAFVSNIQYAGHWRSKNPAPDYFATVAASLQSRDRPVDLADQAVPQFIMWGFRYPENTYSHMFPLYADKTRYPSATSDRLFVFDDTGRLRPAIITPMRRNVPAPDRGCGYRVKGGERVSIPLDAPVIGGGWWVRLGYLADGDGTVTVTAGERVHEVPVRKGLHAMYFRADGKFRRITLSGLDRGTSLCTNEVVLGLPEPFVPQ